MPDALYVYLATGVSASLIVSIAAAVPPLPRPAPPLFTASDMSTPPIDELKVTS